MYHVANTSGFIMSDHFRLCNEPSNSKNEDRSEIFLNAFEELIKDRKLMPKKSIIVLDQSKHHMTRTKRKVFTALTPNSSTLR